jgi:hypothetical protein
LLNYQRREKRRQIDEEERLLADFKAKQQKLKLALEREHDEAITSLQEKFRAQITKQRAKLAAKGDHDAHTSQLIAEESRKSK